MDKQYFSPEMHIVQNFPRYNSWPMIETVGGRLICAYSRGDSHSISEACRSGYVRVSDDGGITWQEENLIRNNEMQADVPSGSGVDSTGAMLLWMRSCTECPFRISFTLLRTVDGKKFEQLCIPQLAIQPMQITGIFFIPEVGLVSLWFAGNYRSGEDNSYGMLVSKDDGKSWEQCVIGSNLPKHQWPTEPAAVYLGNGRILVIARRENTPNQKEKSVQFQLESKDYGKTWSLALTNIDDILESTPSLIYDPETGLISNYYFQRFTGLLKRRTALAEEIIGNPNGWSEPVVICHASEDGCHAGNVQATVLGKKHILSIYTGNEKDTAVVVVPVNSPSC